MPKPKKQKPTPKKIVLRARIIPLEMVPVPADKDASQRMRELLGRIETEPDRDKFAALVEELNRMLKADGPI